MNLVIDIGNTFIKVFVFEKRKISFSQKISSTNIFKIFDLINDFQKPENIIVSSVIKLPDVFYHKINNHAKKIIYLDEKIKLPIINKYKSKTSLGKDRIAAAVGANTIFPDTNVLVIDAGTALTIDFVSEKNEYRGGNISPGMQMRFKALNTFTNKLPLLDKSEEFYLTANNTNDAIISGVQNGIIFEMDKYIHEYKKKYTDLKVILTGGDSFFFEHKLKNRIFAKPFLTAVGLNRILEYNAEQI
ncbi:MAG: type III pantothenate kinase [Bacteroidales bacterium]|nr:type III pantothenate kinase [Bacteroidales bacterium]